MRRPLKEAWSERSIARRDAASRVVAVGITAEKQEGIGLGLPIAKNLVVIHGRKAWMEPISPTGSCFVVSLPRKEG